MQDQIAQLRAFPTQLETLVIGLSPEQRTTAYLDGEWSVAQNVHHLVDSHMNAYIRSKLIATEERPTIRPYDQDAWATLPDAQPADLSVSLAMLHALHARWASFFQTLPNDAWQRTGFHPENGVITLESILHTYVAHGLGHLDQIQRTLAAASDQVTK